jgi:hypothetical protein
MAQKSAGGNLRGQSKRVMRARKSGSKSGKSGNK